MSAAKQAEEQFKKHDWQSDEKWCAKLRAIELPAEGEDAALEKLKRKHFKANVNDQLELNTNSSSTQPQPEPQPQPQPQPKPQPQTQTRPQPASSNTPRSTPPPSTNARAASAPKTLQKITFALNVVVLIASILSIFSTLAYRIALGSALCTLASSLYLSGKLNRRVLSREGFSSFAFDPTSQYFLYCLIHIFFANVFVTVLPLATMAFVHACTYALSSGLYASSPYLSKYEPQMRVLTSAPMVAKFLETNALSEIMLVFALILHVFVGRSGFIHPFLHVQFLRLKYATSTESRAAWGRVSQKVDSVFHHPMCPAVVGGVVDRLKGAVHRYGSGLVQHAD